jgi:hypothetical protein
MDISEEEKKEVMKAFWNPILSSLPSFLLQKYP